MGNSNTSKLALSALLCSIGIAIPMFSPVKIIIPPASFTLGSHVAIFIAMYISPSVAVIVSLGTAIGFFFGGFPPVIVWRAATHVIFAAIGASVIKKNPSILNTKVHIFIFSVVISLIHAICEVAVVTVFYLGNDMSQVDYTNGFAVSVVLLVGLGTVVHSMVDFSIALAIWKAIPQNKAMMRR